MDYKKIIRNRSLRLKILRFLSFVPDQLMLKIQYRIKTGRRLDLKNPQRFTEKLQWYKLHYRNPLMIQCVDKYEVRQFVEAKGLKELLLPCYGVFDSADDVNWDTLPNQFVMKDTLGMGGASVIIVKDKTTVNIEELKRRASEWTAVDAHVRDGGREWPYYSGKKHRIIIEAFLEADDKEFGLIDYKFFCFDGEIRFLYVMGCRDTGKNVKVTLMDRDFHRIPVSRVGDEELGEIKKPVGYERMLAIAETLSCDFPHVRIDLYNIGGVIRFGEMTFYNASGYMKYNPDTFDYEIGRQWKLPL